MLDFKELQDKADKSLVNNVPSPKLVSFIYILLLASLVLVDYFFFKMSLIINIVVAFFAIFLTVGLNWYCLRVSRNENPPLTTLIEPFKHFFKVFSLSLIILVLTVVFGLLLIIPGIIVAIKLSQAFNIIHDNPKTGIIDALKESNKLMKGRVMEYVKLNFSLLPWVIMIFASGGMIILYVIPICKITGSNYYNSVSCELANATC